MKVKALSCFSKSPPLFSFTFANGRRLDFKVTQRDLLKYIKIIKPHIQEIVKYFLFYVLLTICHSYSYQNFVSI